MTWCSHPLPPVPETTAAKVRAAFPQGNLYVDLRNAFGSLYEDDLFADLYADRGHPVEGAPWRLARTPVQQTINATAMNMVRIVDWLRGKP
jgi:transposase